MTVKGDRGLTCAEIECELMRIDLDYYRMRWGAGVGGGGSGDYDL